MARWQERYCASTQAFVSNLLWGPSQYAIVLEFFAAILSLEIKVGGPEVLPTLHKQGHTMWDDLSRTAAVTSHKVRAQNCQGKETMNEQCGGAHAWPYPRCKLLALHGLAKWPRMFCSIHAVKDGGHDCWAPWWSWNTAHASGFPMNLPISILTSKVPLQLRYLRPTAWQKSTNDCPASETLTASSMVVRLPDSKQILEVSHPYLSPNTDVVPKSWTCHWGDKQLYRKYQRISTRWIEAKLHLQKSFGQYDHQDVGIDIDDGNPLCSLLGGVSSYCDP